MTSDKLNIKKLDSPWRRIALPPKETLISLGLTSGLDFADIGCGIGYFTIPAATIIQPSNVIFAIDPSAEMLAEASKRAAEEGHVHIKFVLSEPLDFKVPTASVDFALLANVFHEIEEKEAFIGIVKVILKPGGRMALIEWNSQIKEMGPPSNHRISEEETDRWMEENGFEIIKKLNIGEMFYGRVYVKQC
jgi:ubiquinone/menaquinone biosynthesis C-methylase UbiE